MLMVEWVQDNRKYVNFEYFTDTKNSMYLRLANNVDKMLLENINQYLGVSCLDQRFIAGASAWGPFMARCLQRFAKSNVDGSTDGWIINEYIEQKYYIIDL